MRNFDLSRCTVLPLVLIVCLTCLKITKAKVMAATLRTTLSW